MKSYPRFFNQQSTRNAVIKRPGFHVVMWGLPFTHDGGFPWFPFVTVQWDQTGLVIHCMKRGWIMLNILDVLNGNWKPCRCQNSLGLTRSLCISFCNRRLWWRSFANIWSVSGAFAVQLVHFSHLAWRCSFFSLWFLASSPVSVAMCCLPLFHICRRWPWKFRNKPTILTVGSMLAPQSFIRSLFEKKKCPVELQATGAGVCATRPDELLGMCWRRRRSRGGRFCMGCFFCVCRIMSLCPLLPLEVKRPVYRYTAMLHGFGRQRESSFPKTAQKYRALTVHTFIFDTSLKQVGFIISGQNPEQQFYYGPNLPWTPQLLLDFVQLRVI